MRVNSRNISAAFLTHTQAPLLASNERRTVISNNSASLDGTYRTLVVVVADDGDGGYRTKAQTGDSLYRESSGLGDGFTNPGQYVTVR